MPMNIDVSRAIDCASEYLLALERMYSLRVKHGFKSNRECWVNSYPDTKDACAWVDSARNAPYALEYVAGLNTDVLIRCAKAMNEYFNRGGYHIVDGNALYHSML